MKFTAEKSVKTYTEINVKPGVYYSRYSEDEDENTYRKITVTEDKVTWITVKDDWNIQSITFTPLDDYMPFYIERVFDGSKDYHELTESDFNAVYDKVLAVFNARNS